MVRVDTDLPALSPAQLSEAYVRERFLNPPRHWQSDARGSDPFCLCTSFRPAAVLLPIVHSQSFCGQEGREGELEVLLTQRSPHLKKHAGQISFPGGRLEDKDANAVEAALRETWEEVGIAPGQVDVLGELPKYRVGTGYDVTPVVGMVFGRILLALQTSEVSEAFTVPLSFLMTPANHRWHEMVTIGPDGKPQQRRWLSMDYIKGGRRYFIWGATAAMLRNLYRFLHAEP